MSDRPLILISEHLSQEACAWLEKKCLVVRCSYDDPEFTRHLAYAQGLIVRTYTIVDDAMLDLAKSLKVVGRAGAGLDNVDLKACQTRGIEVVYRPDANTQAVVEYVLSLMCDALRPKVVLNCAVDREEWDTLRAQTVGRRQMNELTLGILGLGRIGSRLGRVAQAIGFEVLYHDLLEIPPDDRFGAMSVPLESLFESSDVLSLHVDGRPENRHFVREDLLQRMKSDAILINTSRGFIVDNFALAGALKDRPEMLALLDVHDPEPILKDSPLLGLPNIRLFPHLASRTQWAMGEMSWVARDVMAVLEGERPKYSAL